MKSVIVATILSLGLGTAAMADQLSVQTTDSTVAALGGLEVGNVDRGEMGWGAGVGGTYFNNDEDFAGAVGLQYGVSDNLNLNAKLARSFNKESYAVFVGVSGKF